MPVMPVMKVQKLGTLWLVALAASLLAPSMWAREERRDRVKPELDYRIGPEDLLQITVWNNEALSQVVPVRPDGMISLPLLDDVRAAGLTPVELRDVLTAALKEFVSQPVVSVIVNDVRSYKVSVLGQVQKPGRYDLRSWATVLDVLAMAGGFTEYATRSRILILRENGRATIRIPFNYDRISSDDGNEVNLQVRPGDVVLVP